jgi:hypothetical protein
MRIRALNVEYSLKAKITILRNIALICYTIDENSDFEIKQYFSFNFTNPWMIIL